MQFQSVTKRGSNGQPDVISVPALLADWMDRNPEWKRIPEPTPAPVRKAGPSGKTAEKRAASADHNTKEQ